MKLLILILIAIAILYFIVPLFYNPTDDTDKSYFKRSGMALYTDHRTGLQYLSTPPGLFGGGGTLIPRLDADGKHMRVKE